MTRLLASALFLLAFCGCASGAAEQRSASPLVAITMDDLPVHGPLGEGETRASLAERITAAFRAAGVLEVYGFMNAVHVEREPDSERALTAWIDAGYPLGNHTWSHRNLNQLSAREFEDEVSRNEEALQRLSRGRDWRWFRYPYLAEGNDPAKRDSARAVLARRGYRIAAVTMDYGDWQWNDAYSRCRAPGHEAALEALEAEHLETVREMIRISRGLSQALYGRDVPQVLLTHISAFNARMMPRVLEIYRQEGFEFTTLEAAQRDSYFAGYNDPSRPADPTSLQARARDRGIPVPQRTDRAAMLAAACR